MNKVILEERETYIYAKFPNHMENNEIGDTAKAIKEITKKNPRLNLLIDDTGLRYKDLTAKNKLEALEGLRAVNSCPKTAVVIAEEDEKLVLYANFALSYSKNKRIKITHSMDEAIDWVSEIINED